MSVLVCRKGWSARAAEPIRQGSFVCQYAGELLTSAQTAARLAEYDAQAADCPGHALMVSASIILLVHVIAQVYRRRLSDLPYMCKGVFLIGVSPGSPLRIV